MINRLLKIYVSIFILAMLSSNLLAKDTIKIVNYLNEVFTTQKLSYDTGNNTLIFNTLKGERIKMSLGDVLNIEFPIPELVNEEQPIAVLCLDGSIVQGTLKNTEAGYIAIKTKEMGLLKINIEYIKKIENLKAPLAKKPELSKLKDTIFLQNNDKDVGIVIEINSDEVIFNSSLFSEKRIYEWNDISTLFFAQVTSNFFSSNKVLIDINTIYKNRLIGELKDITDDTLILVHKILKEIKIPIKNIRNLYILNGKYIYLSNIEPSNIEEQSFIGPVIYHFRKDSCCYFDNEKPIHNISINKKVYKKGLGIHSKTILSYDLNKKYKRFIAVVGFDDCIYTNPNNSLANIDFYIKGDNNIIFSLKNFSAKDSPKEISIDISSVQKLQFIVDFGKNDGILDRFCIGNAILIKKE